MHYGGYCCRMAEINRNMPRRKYTGDRGCVSRYGSYLSLNGQRLSERRKAGALGSVSCFSFFSNKNMSTGEGGMLLCNSDDIANKARSLRSHCMTTVTLDRHKGHAFDYDVTGVGLNYRPTELVGAIGMEQLEKLEGNNERRQRLVARYRSRLAPLRKHVTVPFCSASGQPAYHIMPVVLGPEVNRLGVIMALKNQRIQSSIHYRSVHEMSGHRSSSCRPLPRTEEYSKRTLTLPLFPSMTTEMVDQVVSALESAVSKCV